MSRAPRPSAVGIEINGLSEIAIYKSLLASANFVDFVSVDDGASAHDAHLDAALSDYDKEFTALQLESGRLDGKRSAPERD